MKPYNGLIKFDKSGKVEDLVAIDESFSFSSFFFNPFWFLFHRMWHEFFGVIIIFIFFNFFFAKLLGDALFLQLFFLIMIALNSRTWLIEHLIKRKNYKFVTIIFANSAIDAKMLLIKNLVNDPENSSAELAEIFSNSILNPAKTKSRKQKTQKTNS